MVSTRPFERAEITAAVVESFSTRLWRQAAAHVGGGGLELGEPDFDPPRQVFEACRAAIAPGRTRYTDSRGRPELREAIARINRTSRRRFRETFDAVNERFQQNFPRLFEGGKASLSLAEAEDVLEAGIEIMAQPPGKRVTSLHLLSGGEKALTAVAFVFAIFRLNPAPFCLLDEVDAPLDDVNAVRFSEMVKDMSDRVQFVIVTHNKITMEIAEQLIGVTMHEPGVSRLVAVDVDEAVELVAV